MKSTDLEPQGEALSVKEARRALREAEKNEAERKRHEELQRREDARKHREVTEQAAGVAAGVREQVAAALAFAAENPPQPTHHARTVARAWLHGALIAPVELMATAESRVAEIDPVLGHLLAAAEECANRLNYYCSPAGLDVWLGPGDAPIVELDRLEADAWRCFTDRVKVIAAES